MKITPRLAFQIVEFNCLKVGEVFKCVNTSITQNQTFMKITPVKQDNYYRNSVCLNDGRLWSIGFNGMGATPKVSCEVYLIDSATLTY